MNGEILDAFLATLWTSLGLDASLGRMEWGRHWAAGEGTGARFNPLATTLPAPAWEDAADPWWNTFAEDQPWGPLHVRNYRDLASGVAATAQTIRQANFRPILQTLMDERLAPGAVDCMRSTWGTVRFANELAAGWLPAGWASSMTPPPAIAAPLTADQLNAAMQRRMALRRIGLVILTRAEDPDLDAVDAYLGDLVAHGFRP